MALKTIPILRTFTADPRQREAIEHVHGPMLVTAGAGTGKTTVLTHRIARLVRESYARPEQILALTYTVNSAQKMRDAVRDKLRGVDLSGLHTSTFHDYCNSLLRKSGKGFEVVDDKELWVFLRRQIRELKLNYFCRAANVGEFLDDLLNFHRRCQDELVSPEKYAAYVEQLKRGEVPVSRVGKDCDDLDEETLAGRCEEIAHVFTTVEKMLREEGLGTFGHMIVRAHDLLYSDKKVLEGERSRFRFILIDEFQDANFAQIRILQQLAGPDRNVFAVGDPDQAIYKFRGASSEAFRMFQRHFPGTKVVVLDRNRRSTTPILQCAYAVIAQNPSNFATGEDSPGTSERSPLISTRDCDLIAAGETPEMNPVEGVILAQKQTECADVVWTLLQKKKQLRCAWKDFAVLYRLHSHCSDLPAELAEHNIPFAIENMDLLETPEVRDLLACLKSVVSPGDGVSLFRIAALPQFILDPEKLRAAVRAVPRDSQATGLFAVLHEVEGGRAVLETLQRAKDEISHAGAKGRHALEIMVRHFALDRFSEPLAAFLNFVSAWEGKATTKTKELNELLEYLEYFREARGEVPMPSRQDEDAVSLMTAHGAKGLEFDHVFILRANKPSFPYQFREPLIELPAELRDPDSMAQDENKTLHEQEERRLFYVAMTRARDSLSMYVSKGKAKGEVCAPGFLRELTNNPELGRYFRFRDARAFQTDMFGQGTSAPSSSRVVDWVLMPPGSDLGARLSASAIQTYETCPLRFKLEREWRISSEVAAAMHYGAAMHEILRTYYDSVRFERPMPEDALMALLESKLMDAPIPDRYQYELYARQGREQLQGFLNACRQRSAPNVEHTEEAFEVKINGITVAGRVDRIDRIDSERVAIIDYKTGRPQSQDDAEKSLQLSIYALAAREKWGYRVDRLEFYNLASNVAVITRRSEAQLCKASVRVEQAAKKIVQGEFEPKAGFHCKFCPYQSLCPATERKLYVPVNSTKTN
ncbi:MAG: ATP-dependent helicase [Acidobacteriales bacterium]|nr:ATP-dependent helicase [Terriglobales bacterium]